MKIALVHDYLLESGGAERVLRVLSDMYPEAPIYTALSKNGSARALFSDRLIIESSWAPLLKLGRLYSYARFLLPWVWKSLDLSEYDLIITSCSGYIARGFKVRPGARVIAYCHTPPRWLYGYDTPTGAQHTWWGKAFMWVVGPWVRTFDYESAQRVNTWIANSKEVARRIGKFYRQDARVIYPPIELKRITSRVKKKNYYLMVSRIVGGKGIAEAVQAFKQLRIPLKIVGEIVDQNLGREVESLGRVSEEELGELYRSARGFVALARDEDLGMTVIESMLCGTPVLAYQGGGYLETVRPGKTGVFIQDITPEAIGEGIKKMEATAWSSSVLTAWAARFGRDRFEREIKRVVGV